MWSHLDPILLGFRSCFSREASFHWFVVIVCGFIVRLDHLGISSFTRWLFMEPALYTSMVHFFRATSWRLEPLLEHWVTTVLRFYPLVEFNGRSLLIGDGTKACKEATKMPAVKSLHQDSENNGKPEFIRGHHFGVVGVLAGHAKKTLCLPLEARLHEGISNIQRSRSETPPATPVSLMAWLLVEKAKQIGRPCYAVLDAYFAVKTSFLIFARVLNESGQCWVHLITRAKTNYVAYWRASEQDHDPSSKWEKVHLMDVFDLAGTFHECQLNIAGRTKLIKYTFLDMLWKPVKERLRFVFIVDGTGRYILMCSDLTLHPEVIIEIYAHRWKIEVMFMALKHLIGGFCYRFWTKHFPRLERGQTLKDVELTQTQLTRCVEAVCAIERFVNLAAIALGLLQYLSLTKPTEALCRYQGWLRTASSETPSEAVVQSVLRAEFYSNARKVPVHRTLSIIRTKCRDASLLEAA